jgi:hypothetical protein
VLGAAVCSEQVLLAWRSNGDIEVRVEGAGGCVMLGHVDGSLGAFGSDSDVLHMRLESAKLARPLWEQ